MGKGIAYTSDHKALRIGGQYMTLANAGTYTPPPVDTTPTPDPVPDPFIGPLSTASMPVSGISGWWDVSTMPILGGLWSITDKSTAANNAGASGITIFPRVVGNLNGAYAKLNPSNYSFSQPCISDYAVTVNTATVGPNQAFTTFLVWTRPARRQPAGVYSSESVSLIDLDGVNILNMSGIGDGTDTITLFPTLAPIKAPVGLLAHRHTHSVRLVFSNNSVDVWLDDQKIITGAANQIVLGTSTKISYLNNAQCIYHEAAAWSKTLSDSEHSDLTGYAKRWIVGTRYPLHGILMGQSNAGHVTAYPMWHMSDKICYLAGVPSANVFLRTEDTSNGYGNISTGSTMWSGQGLYNPGSSNGFLDTTSGDANVDNWPLGSNGNQFVKAINSMHPSDRAGIRFICWYWSESDSAMLKYAMKDTYARAMKNAIKKIRDTIGGTADSIAFMVINAIPFTTDEGCQTHREVMQDLVNTAGLNVHFMLYQGDDAAGEGSTFDTTTGIESGFGNNSHRDSDGQEMYVQRFGIPITHAAITSNASTPDIRNGVQYLDGTIAAGSGPKIINAKYEGNASVLVTVQHDKGTDLVLKLRALQGVGWEIMDGINDTQPGTPGTPGNRIKAISCERVSSTQVRVIFASSPQHVSTSKLYYDYGSGLDVNNYAVISRGNAVYDNYDTLNLAAGWTIKTDFAQFGFSGTDAAKFQPAYPIQATTYGIPLS